MLLIVSLDHANELLSLLFRDYADRCKPRDVLARFEVRVWDGDVRDCYEAALGLAKGVCEPVGYHPQRARLLRCTCSPSLLTIHKPPPCSLHSSKDLHAWARWWIASSAGPWPAVVAPVAVAVAVTVAVTAALSNSPCPAQATASALRQAIAVSGAHPHHDDAHSREQQCKVKVGGKRLQGGGEDAEQG
jgi:hypothetical protein